VPGRTSRRLRPSLGPLLTGIAAALIAVGGARSASATDYTLAVDAGKELSGNPHFWSAAFGTGKAKLALRSDWQTHYKIGNRELGAQRVRGHGLLNDEMGLYKGAGSYDWTNLDTYLTAVTSAGMRPVIELDFMPTALATNGDKSPPKDYAAWKAFVVALVQHCIDKYGMNDVASWYFEVWNEPDYSGFWLNTDINAYYTLYDNTAAALTSIIPNALVNDNNARISAITSTGYSTADVKSFNTEWNSSYSGQGGNMGNATLAMDNHWNVGFILKAAKLLADKDSGDTPAIDVLSYWVLTDVFDEDGGTDGIHMTTKSNGNTPFDGVFGLMTFQGMRKAAFNAFKLLNYTGTKRLSVTGGTGTADGVDAMVTTSANGDELEILVFNYYKTLNTPSGTGDNVTVNVSNLPPALANKSVHVTRFVVDETHSNPYNVWSSQGKPASPSEMQWEQMRAAQHLALGEPASTAQTTQSFSASFTLPRQAGTLLLVGLNRPVTGRDAFVEIEGEDYDGQSSATKEDSGDMTLGQSLSIASGGSAFYDKVDFSDAGVKAVELRAKAMSAVTVELHADMPTGPSVASCAVPAGNAWATQTCNVMPTTGVHDLYVVPSGAVHLNWLKFEPVSGDTGAGGAGGTGAAGTPGGGGVTAAGGAPSSGGSMAVTGGTGATTAGGPSTTTGGSPATGGSGVQSGTGGAVGSGGTAGGQPATGGTAPGIGGAVATSGGMSATAGGAPSGNSGGKGGGGCGCRVPAGSTPSKPALLTLLLANFGVILRRRRRPGTLNTAA
jgi:xylan 1,4-beta-xylosidase